MKPEKAAGGWLHEWRDWVFWPLAIGAALAGLLGIQLGLKWHEEFVKSVGEAFLIAAFLAVTVDHYVKRRLLHEVSNDVSKYLIGYELPPEMQERIKELMSCKIVRENYEAHYEATHRPDGRLNVVVTISYDVRNITQHSESYRQHLALEDRDSPVIRNLKCESQDKSATYDLLGRDVFLHQNGVVEAFGPEIIVRPVTNKKKFSYRITDSHSLIQPIEYSDLISFRYPTINVTISHKFPPDVIFVAPAAELPGTAAANSSEYRQLFMPTEHIRLRWFKRKP